jgi:LysR family hydrogen peroxide-inducible transcriptional activator
MQRSKISMALAAVSLRDLALLQAVFREGSFNRAARQMHISPSGLSHQIQKIEQALGQPLFERGGRRITPTAAGVRVAARVERLLAVAEDLEHDAHAGGAAFGGEFRLGVLATLGPYLLPHLIEPFPQHFSGVRLAISEGKPRGLLRRLQEGELDAVLGPADMPVVGLASQPLFFEPYEVLMRRDYPLADRHQVSLDALGPEDATLMAETHDVDALTSVLAFGGSATSERVQDVSLETLASLVALRGGYTLVPALAHERLASVPSVTLARIEGQAPGRRLALYWREASPWRDDLEAFEALLGQVADQIDGLVRIGGEVG